MFTHLASYISIWLITHRHIKAITSCEAQFYLQDQSLPHIAPNLSITPLGGFHSSLSHCLKTMQHKPDQKANQLQRALDRELKTKTTYTKIHTSTYCYFICWFTLWCYIVRVTLNDKGQGQYEQCVERDIQRGNQGFLKILSWPSYEWTEQHHERSERRAGQHLNQIPSTSNTRLAPPSHYVNN